MKFKGQQKKNRNWKTTLKKVLSISFFFFFCLVSIEGKNKWGENFWIEIKGNIDGHVPSNFSVKSGSKGVQPKINIVAKENLFFPTLFGFSSSFLFALSLSLQCVPGNPILSLTLFILVCEFWVSYNVVFVYVGFFSSLFSHFVASGVVEFVSK